MNLKLIILLLIIIIIFPALFYTAYELNALDENERMITEIYERQLNTVLFSVNQYTLDIVNSWINTIENNTDITELLAGEESIESVFTTDSILSEVILIGQSSYHEPLPVDKITGTVRSNREKFVRQLEYISNYRKIEPILIESDTLKILFSVPVIKNNIKNFYLIIINSNIFFSDYLQPKIEEISGGKFIVSIYREGLSGPIITTATNAQQVAQAEESFLESIIPLNNNLDETLVKDLWLFPGHKIGLTLGDNSIQNLSRDRFINSLRLIFIMDLILIFAVIIIYRALKRQVELTRMKSDFVSNVSHELRTPLALIRMYAETLEMQRVPNEEKKQEYYKIICSETDRLTHLINNILDFSKMEAGKKTYQFEPMSINELIEETLNAYDFHIQQNNFKLDKKLTSNLPDVKADKRAITEAFINLLDNAVKYSKDRKELKIESGSENGMVYFSITDSGMGIPEKDQKMIFDKFFRVSQGLTHNTKGSGLGLTLVKFIVDAHKGKIEVK